MKKLFVAATLFAAVASASASPIRIGMSNSSYGNSVSNVNYMISSGALDAGSTLTTFGSATFNAMTPSQLRASYDVLVFGWVSGGDFATNWSTRLLPYLQAGGGIVWEDPTNASGIAGLTIGGGWSSSYVSNCVAGLTCGSDANASNLNDGLTYEHFSIASYDSNWTVYERSYGGSATGVAGTFGAGRIVVAGPDSLYHGDPTYDTSEYRMALNEIRYVAPSAVPEPASLALLSAGLLGAGLARKRKNKNKAS